VATINFIADTITKNTCKNLILVRIIDNLQAKIKRYHIVTVINFIQIFVCNYTRYKIIRLVSAVSENDMATRVHGQVLAVLIDLLG
jgi:hypothetical protein